MDQNGSPRIVSCGGRGSCWLPEPGFAVILEMPSGDGKSARTAGLLAADGAIATTRIRYWPPPRMPLDRDKPNGWTAMPVIHRITADPASASETEPTRHRPRRRRDPDSRDEPRRMCADPLNES